MGLERGDLTDEVPDLGPPPTRLAVEIDTVRALVADQFPQWKQLSVLPVDAPGWDNFTFRLGGDMLVRMPSAAQYALAVEKEHRLLPELAPQLPVPIPAPLAMGRPAMEYPFRWSVYGWLQGEPADPNGLADPMGVAEDVTAFLWAFRQIDATGGPQPGIHNWFRGATLRTFDRTARHDLTALEGDLDVAKVGAIWDDAVNSLWDGADTWFHGDLAPGNLLLAQGRLAGVIDFGTCGVGDPSCDLAIAWTLLDRSGRRLLREGLGVEEPTWARGRGWALWKALRTLVNALEDLDESSSVAARAVIDAILEDHAGTT